VAARRSPLYYDRCIIRHTPAVPINAGITVHFIGSREGLTMSDYDTEEEPQATMDQPDDLPRPDPQTDLVVGDDRAEPPREVLDL
jgi:hypothetical protein